LDRIGYVILYVSDLQAAIRFYRDRVGLTLRFTEHGYAEFEATGTKFGLFERSRLQGLIGAEAAEAAPDVEILFPVEDADAEARRLRAAGVDILAGPLDRSWGHRTVHIVDPDGNVVELAQDIPRSAPRRGDDGKPRDTPSRRKSRGPEP
jgi:lactoylglutathione lyase